MDNIECIKYTLKHRVAFTECVKKYLKGKDREELIKRAKVHDMDKVILYNILSLKDVKNFHREHARHHIESNSKNLNRYDYLEMIIDWECARYTKDDKLLNAYETLYKFYPKLEDKILPILKELKLDYNNVNHFYDKKILNAVKDLNIDENYIKAEIKNFLLLKVI